MNTTDNKTKSALKIEVINGKWYVNGIEHRATLGTDPDGACTLIKK